MRANLIFVLGLIATVACTSTSFQALLTKDAEYLSSVQNMKQANNMGSIIMTMAELTDEQGKFAALFAAIDDLSKFLVNDRATENNSYKQATAQYNSVKSRLSKERDHANSLVLAYNAQLKNKLYPTRLRLQTEIAKQESQLKNLELNLKTLRENRVKEIAQFKQRSTDYSAGIEACKKALPLLRSLANGQSFAELDSDVFESISTDLKKSLGKLEMGQLYVVFVESMVQTLTKQNYVEQQKLLKVIGLIADLQDRLQKGVVALTNDEALNLKRFNSTQASLESAISVLQQSLAKNRASLVLVNAKIAEVEKKRDVQQAIFNDRVAQLVVVENTYKQRTQDHLQFIREIDAEEATIAEAVRILNKGGVTRKH